MTTITYLLYIIIGVGVAIFVSRTLSKNSEIYLTDGFNGDKVLAKAVNSMLVIGFYLLNIGFVLMRLENNQQVMNFETLIIYLSDNIGFILIMFGGLHFLNMVLVYKFRESAMKYRLKKQEQELESQKEHWTERQ